MIIYISKGGGSINQNNMATHLIEANWIETKAEVEEANGDAIEDAEEHHRLQIDRLGLKEIEPLRDVKGAERNHQMPACQRRRCNNKK